MILVNKTLLGFMISTDLTNHPLMNERVYLHFLLFDSRSHKMVHSVYEPKFMARSSH